MSLQKIGFLRFNLMNLFFENFFATKITYLLVMYTYFFIFARKSS